MGGAKYPRPKDDPELDPCPDLWRPVPWRPDRPWGVGMVLLSVFEILAQTAVWSSAVSRARVVDAELCAGAAFLVLSILRLVGGIGAIGGRRWGFRFAAVASGLFLVPYVALTLACLYVPFFLADLTLFLYCWRRLGGRLGPRPL